ncbi:hypothetical protein [Enterococcus sp. 9D6_DIV0238]|uniref:TPR repeat-containing protein n=1 Tax=Candidatus Enterococcus dunnyi TaxID=1834192 RepID=A0AAQ3Y1L3_9ENTE|nr:hypothetical protein [Enterococcus sp. 9D6_DIV0238]
MLFLSNKIPFPKNYERYIEMGQEALQLGNKEAALSYFEKAYAIKQDFPLNLVLANTYLDTENYEKALYVVSEMRESYFEYLDYLEIYIHVLTKNQLFLQAHSIINERILMEQSGEMRKLISLKKKVKHVELKYQQFESVKISEVKKELNQLNLYDYYEQLSVIKKSLNLPQDDFIRLGKNLLLDGRVHILVRSWILEELVKLHVKEEVKFLWRDDQTYTVIPATVGTPLDCAAYQRILLFLEKELINVAPILLVDITEEIRLHFTLLYPLADQIIKNPRLWAISYIISYNQSMGQKYHIEEKEEIKKIQKIQHEIRLDLETMVQ